MTETHHLTSSLDEIERLNARLGNLWAENELPAHLEFPVTVALEEVLSNVVRHSGAGEISVRFSIEAGCFEFEVGDDGPAFNPLELPAFDPSAPLEARRAGGMGVHIVRQYADELRWEYRDERNTLLFRKRL